MYNQAEVCEKKKNSRNNLEKSDFFQNNRIVLQDPSPGNDLQIIIVFYRAMRYRVPTRKKNKTVVCAVKTVILTRKYSNHGDSYDNS